MLHRIVRMTFAEGAVDDFLRIYVEAEPLIRSFPGCRHLELWRRNDEAAVLATYSIWEGAEALEAYRKSDRFRGIWSSVKPLFAAPAQAESFITLSLDGAETES